MKKIGIITSLLPKEETPALHYLLLHLNRLQSFFELELIDIDIEDSSLLEEIYKNQNQLIEMQDEKGTNKLKIFKSECREYIEKRNVDFRLPQNTPEYFIILSQAFLPGNYYYRGIDSVGIIGLYNWENKYAPPSLLEYFLVLTVRVSLDFVCNVSDLTHYGTKGCLFDFNRDLQSVRYKILNGHVCSNCTKIINDKFGEEIGKKLTEEIEFVLSKEWFGDHSITFSPSSIAEKLGFVLFYTQKLQQSRWEIIVESFWQQLGRQPLIFIGVILVTITTAIVINPVINHFQKQNTDTNTSSSIPNSINRDYSLN
ncbi:MAG: hypothetical protein AB4063_25970 [Crocosphaera sp.]